MENKKKKALKDYLDTFMWLYSVCYQKVAQVIQ